MATLWFKQEKELCSEITSQMCLFIMKTKIDVNTIISSSIFNMYDSIIGVDAVGQGGGLFLALKSVVNLTIIQKNERFIEIVICKSPSVKWN